MLEVYTYNAGKGDCIRVRFAETHNIFIDTGVTRFGVDFRQICKKIVSSGQTLDALVLTHEDDDHIGGMLANLRSSSYKCPFNEVWMNHSGSARLGNATLSTRQNNEVYARLIQSGVTVASMHKEMSKDIAGATIKVFWPEKITGLSTEERSSRNATLAHHNDYGYSLTQLAQMPIQYRDTSRSNKQSIVFSFSYEGHNLLFTGDAWSEDVVKAAGSYDLIKISHHGSVRNISESYKTSFRSNNFLICTDGVDHPDKQTIAKLESWYGEINIYSPSAWWRRGFFVADDREHKINFFQKEGLVIAW